MHHLTEPTTGDGFEILSPLLFLTQPIIYAYRHTAKPIRRRTDEHATHLSGQVGERTQGHFLHINGGLVKNQGIRSVYELLPPSTTYKVSY